MWVYIERKKSENEEKIIRKKTENIMRWREEEKWSAFRDILSSHI